MNVKKWVAQGSVAGVLAVGAIGAAPVAVADPDWHDWNHNEWIDRDFRGNNLNWNDNDWNKWWRVNKWRNDDRPPWGWGPPPAVQWRGNIPHDFDYWGYRVYPIWNPGFHAWGFWLFGIFIPIVVL